jgi:stage III sporulation protein AA
MADNMGQGRNRKEEISSVLAVTLRTIFDNIDVDFERLQEIRLRRGAPFMVVCGGKEYFVDEQGKLGNLREKAYTISLREIRETMEFISNYSLYAFEEELRQGFITIQGGHRVGVAGKAILEKDRVKSLRYISFINIRLAHEVIGCSEPVFPYITEGESIYHTLIVSPPRCGKTTLLRDLIRQISNGGNNHPGVNVGVVDERSELGACYQGYPQNNLGYRTDVLDCCPKKEGMLMLVRSMSPRVIAVDEIGSVEDVEALEYVMHCGVKILATVHGKSMEELYRKPVLGERMRNSFFERYILLSSGDVGRVEAVFDEKGSLLVRL